MIIDSPANRYVKQLKNEMGFDDGWYFIDETENYEGPYPTEDAAASAMVTRAKNLEHNAG